MSWKGWELYRLPGGPPGLAPPWLGVYLATWAKDMEARVRALEAKASQ